MSTWSVGTHEKFKLLLKEGNENELRAAIKTYRPFSALPEKLSRRVLIETLVDARLVDNHSQVICHAKFLGMDVTNKKQVKARLLLYYKSNQDFALDVAHPLVAVDVAPSQAPAGKINCQ